MAKLKSGTRIYGTATIDTSVVVGSAVTANSSGIQVAGIVTATQLVSTVATGTAPFVIASATVVTNLNADLLDGLNSATTNTGATIVARDGSGNFSAGTITASLTGAASLNVMKAGDTMTGQLISTLANNTATNGGQIYLNGASGNRIDFNTSGTGAPAFTTRSAGTKIVLYPAVSGIGVDAAFGTDNANLWSSVPSSAEQFRWYAGTTNIATLGGTGNLSITGIATATQLDLTASATANDSVLYLSGAPLGTNSTNGLLGIGALSFSDTNIIANFAHSVNSYVQLVVQNKNSGASSSADIIVNNDRSAGTTYYGDFGINGTTFSGGGVFGDVDGTYLYSAGGTLSLGSLNSFDVKIAVNNTERVRINATGVGIGTTNPTVELQLSPDASISNVGFGITLSSTVGLALTVAQFLYSNGNTSRFRIKATRNATGSDWTTASTKLLTVTDVTEQAYIEFNPLGSNVGGATGLSFGTGATEWARFLSSGNLGIGSTSPTTALDVNGILSFSRNSTVRIGNSLTGGGSSGIRNVVIGAAAGGSNTSGNDNVYVGQGAGYWNTSGSRNVYIGPLTSSSGSSTTSEKVIIGTGFPSGTGSGSGSFFDAPSPTKSTQLAIGIVDSGSQSRYWLVGDENFNVGIGTTNPTSKFYVVGNAYISGISTLTQISAGGTVGTAGSILSSTGTGLSWIPAASGGTAYATSAGIATYATTAGVSTSVIGGIGSITQLQVTGISTFTNGPVLVGAATSTGTALQRLQVTDGAYVSGNLGVGVTNPGSKIDVSGDIAIRATDSATQKFTINFNEDTDSLDFDYTS
jgi:hypothetical protein